MRPERHDPPTLATIADKLDRLNRSADAVEKNVAGLAARINQVEPLERIQWPSDGTRRWRGGYEQTPTLPCKRGREK